MDIYTIAAASHYATGKWCKCGEKATDCWFLAVFYPYKERAGQALYEGLFGSSEASDSRPIGTTPEGQTMI